MPYPIERPSIELLPKFLHFSAASSLDVLWAIQRQEVPEESNLESVHFRRKLNNRNSC